MVTNASGNPTSEISAADWVRQFAAALGTTPPTEDEINTLLAIAGVAAHASERTAAPLSTWLVGRAGITPEQARAAAVRLATALGPERDG